MEIKILDSSDADALRPLFSNKRMMGVDTTHHLFMEDDADFLKVSYDAFCDTYLANLNNYKAFGSIENGIVTSLISFIEPIDTADWYGTKVRSLNRQHIPDVLDKVIEYNEENGRYKFYSMFGAKYRKSYRRFAFSEWAQERYEYVDEILVPAKTRCVYLTYWLLLYGRTLIPTDSIVRCTFLKQKYRETLPIGGNI